MNIKLTKTDQSKWVRNMVVFLAPLGILYLTTVIGVISQDFHVFRLEDLIPNATARGGMVLWVLNAALDYLRKLSAE